MSIAALCLNGFLATLLLTALALGVRLDRKLKGVRDGQQAFVLAVHELNAAAAKAQAALADLRAATDDTTDTLGGRINRARECADRLDKLIARGEGLSIPRAAAPPAPVEQAAAEGRGGLSALLARLDGEMAASGRPIAAEASPVLAGRGSPRAGRTQRPLIDDDLFVDLGDRA